MFFSRIQDKLIDIYLNLKSPLDPCPFGAEYQPYWVRRKEIFSRWDEGIKTDAAGLFSATPERIALDIARNLRSKTVVDAFCGIGATAIAFARVCEKVYAVDLDQNRLDMARHNARIYGVEDKIEFVHSDIFEAMPKLAADAIFLDPPWGGAEYLRLKDFRLKDFNPDGHKLLGESFKQYRTVILRVPRQFKVSELDQHGRGYKIQDNYIRSKLYSRTVYFN